MNNRYRHYSRYRTVVKRLVNWPFGLGVVDDGTPPKSPTPGGRPCAARRLRRAACSPPSTRPRTGRHPRDPRQSGDRQRRLPAPRATGRAAPRVAPRVRGRVHPARAHARDRGPRCAQPGRNTTRCTCGARSTSRFPDITVDSLQRLLPDKNTVVLIYCNNNFRDAPDPMPTKLPPAALNLVDVHVAVHLRLSQRVRARAESFSERHKDRVRG